MGIFGCGTCYASDFRSDSLGGILDGVVVQSAFLNFLGKQKHKHERAKFAATVITERWAEGSSERGYPHHGFAEQSTEIPLARTKTSLPSIAAKTAQAQEVFSNLPSEG